MSKTIHALIIGINAYPSRPLYGCVNDALAVGRFFKEFCNDPDNNHEWNPLYLLAPHPGDASVVEQAALIDPKVANRQLPLRANFVQAFDHFLAPGVRPDDTCLVYYSGHGALEAAAPEFIDLEPDGMNGTFVCLDSRDEGNRDLLDKEFAWLLSKVKKRIPAGHLLVVTDSCHSGGATRSIDTVLRDRRESASDTPTPFSEILGVANVAESERILALAGKQAYYKSEAKHIHLAASRDNETAKETSINGQQHGLFSWNLLRVLNAGGTALSYLEVMRRTEVMVRSMVANQIPQINVYAGAKKSDAFMGGGLVPAAREYPVVFQDGQWQLKAGALNGIVLDPSKIQPTTVLLSDGREINVTEVFSNYALLDPEKFNAEDASTLLFDQRAIVGTMPASKISIFLKKETISRASLMELENAISGLKPKYCDFDAQSEAAADYWVVMDASEHYLLVRKGSDYPVFKRQRDAFEFVPFCNNVGQWRFVQEMGKASLSGFSMDDLEINLEVLSDIDPGTINTAEGQKVSVDDVVLLYSPKEGARRAVVPALRCSVKLKKTGFWVGGLYLDSEFGIYAFLEARQDKNWEAHSFSYKTEGVSYNAIPLTIEAIRIQQGVIEITEYLKIFVSNKDFSLADLEQVPLPLDDQPLKRGTGFGKGFSTTPDWMVMTIPVTIRLVANR